MKIHINRDCNQVENINQWMMLAASSTIAANLTILAAAITIIIIESAESRGLDAFYYFEFFEIGIGLKSKLLFISIINSIKKW